MSATQVTKGVTTMIMIAKTNSLEKALLFKGVPDMRGRGEVPKEGPKENVAGKGTLDGVTLARGMPKGVIGVDLVVAPTWSNHVNQILFSSPRKKSIR